MTFNDDSTGGEMRKYPDLNYHEMEEKKEEIKKINRKDNILDNSNISKFLSLL